MSKEASIRAMSDLPPVLRTGALDRPYNQIINTDILRPVSINQSTCRFVFDKTGILDSNTQLNLAQTVVNSAHPTVNTGSCLPTSTGALAMISRAWLTIGGKTVSDLRDLGHYSTYHRLAFSSEYKKGIIMPKQGGNDIFQGSISRDLLAPGPTSKRSRGFDEPFGVIGRVSSEYAVRNEAELTTQPDVDANFGQQSVEGSDTRESPLRQITTDENTTPSFAVGLSQLIPFLKAMGGVQLPLGLIQEEVALNIEWADPTFGHRFYPPDTDLAGNAITATDCLSTIVTNKVFMMVDYLFYPQDMGEVAQQMTARGGYNIPFTEIQVAEQTKSNLGVGSQTFSFNLAFSGKRVRNVVVQKELTDGANLSVVNTGRYNSLAWLNGEAYNLQINSRNFYSRRLSNVALQKHEMDMATGLKCKVQGARYSWDNNYDPVSGNLSNLMSDRETNGYPQLDEEGSQHWVGIKLQNADGMGVRCSNVPMNYSEEVTIAGGDNLSRRYRFFVGIQRIINMSMGLVTVIE